MTDKRSVTKDNSHALVREYRYASDPLTAHLRENISHLYLVGRDIHVLPFVCSLLPLVYFYGGLCTSPTGVMLVTSLQELLCAGMGEDRLEGFVSFSASKACIFGVGRFNGF